jgi:GntP family gluconate:H+ symporter
MSLAFGLLLLTAGIVLIIGLTSWLKIHSFLALFLVSLLMACIVMPVTDIVPLLKKGFGDTMGSIGLIIVFGAVIGVTLDQTGATVSMASFFLRHIGTRRAPWAITITGFITGLPIFCDSGFIVLSGLNRSMAAKSKSHPVFMSTILACSLYSVHCLIPPHPGATAAAGITGANIGTLVITGIAVAFPAVLVAYAWARFMTRNMVTPEEMVEEQVETRPVGLPSAWKSFMPIVVPLILITVKAFTGIGGAENSFGRISGFVGDPVIALMIGMFLSFSLLRFSRETMNHMLNRAVEKAGPIIIITAAGGIFGAVIKSTGVGEQAGRWLAGTGLGLLIPFLITSLFKTAQGSSTVAIITAASILAPMADSLGFGGESGKLLLMLSMGAGSMAVSHANDSYFWVVTNFSGLNSSDTLRVYSSASLVMGLTSLAMVYLLSLVI